MARRGTSPTKLLPVRRDSSIGATSTNPRLRRGSVIEAAAVRRSSSAPRPDFHSPESKAAMRTLRLLLLPVMLRVVLRRRRRAHWTSGGPPRRYTNASVVSAIAGSKTMLAEWPLRVLERLADQASFYYLGPKEFIVYAHESHVSCGIVVLLYGQLEERRPDAAVTKQKGDEKGGAAGAVQGSSGATSSRPIRTQTHRLHKATDVLCVMPVLCEDRTTSSFTTRDKESADVAVISSRWFWEVYYSAAQSSLPSSDVLTRFMKDVVAPHRRDIVMADYFPTSVVLLRSWMWPLLTASDRVKLCRAMEVRVLGVGEVLYDEGEYSPYIFFVRRGALTVIVKGEALAVLEAGACLGEESVLFHEKRNSSVVSSTMCELYVLHVRHLEHRLTKYPDVGQRLIAAAVERQKRWMEEGKTRDVFGLVSILSGVPCLGHSTDTMREELARCATVHTLPQGHVLAAVNTPCTSLFVIGRGSLALTSLVKPAGSTSASVVPAAGGSRPGSSLPPRRRPSSTAKNNNNSINPRASPTPSEVRREVRSTGDFLGELCLKPHLWPFDVTCETTVSVWQLDRDAILRVLEQNRADAQAIEVCRQGISLYRAQRGEASLIEGFDAPHTPVAASGRRTSAAAAVATRRISRAPSSQGPASRRRASSAAASPAPPMPRMSVSQLDKAEDTGALPPPLDSGTAPDTSGKGRGPRNLTVMPEWTPEQWTNYALSRLQEGLAQEAGDTNATSTDPTAAAVVVSPPRELRPVDKEIEKAMKEKVLRLIAVQPSTPPNPADCDISGECEELQAIVVEQLFLIPTEDQPRFIRQVNDSNVRLVTEEEEPQAIPPAELPLEEDELRDPWQFGEAPISVNGVMRLEDVNAVATALAAAGEDSSQVRMLSSSSFQNGGEPVVSSTVFRPLSENMELSGQVALPPALGRSRRSINIAALEDSAVGLMTSFPARNSVSRSHFVRPPSGLPASPRGMSAVRPGSSSEPRVAPPTRTRPTSVDYNQLNKVGVDRSSSVLDRYVKIEDQNYFDNYVKVLPLQQDEIWAADEVVVEDERNTGSLVLLLLHVRGCDYLAQAAMRRCQRPIVKVTLGQRVLVRTPVMQDVVAPHWPIEESSFITFVRRGTELVFTVCDADDEASVVYQCTLRTATICENGGVGQQTMTLAEASAAGSFPSIDPENADDEARQDSNTALRNNDGKGDSGSGKKPRLATTMLAVTATKYKALKQALKTDKGKEKQQQMELGASTAAATPETSTLFLQVMSVEGLKHRIEASVIVSFYDGGTLCQLLETSQVLPKTRSPAWPADRAFVKVCSDGGVLTFDLLHKGVVISSAETTMDALVFGGVGLHRLPLLQAQTGSVVMGQLVVCVLGASTPGGKESRSRDWVTHLTVEELRLSASSFAITPDPFVVLRDGAGEVRMRTPLACGTFDAIWTMTEASCLLHCPRLSGSTATYRLEVCDSDAQDIVGRASITVTERGLVGGPQHEIALDPPGSGSVRVRSACLPLLELPEKPAKSTPQQQQRGSVFSATSPLNDHPTAPAQVQPADATAVVLIYVSGCNSLPGGAAEEFQTDAIATVTVDGWLYMRTPIREGTTSPRWPIAKAAVLLRVPSIVPAQLKSGKGDGGGGSGHECVFAVYDGVVDEVNEIGQVAVPLEQLLSSASRTLPLFPRIRDAAVDEQGSFLGLPTRQLPASIATTQTIAGVTHKPCLDKTAGWVHVQTLFGRLGHQVHPVGAIGEERADPAVVDMQDAPLSCRVPSMLVPYYNPDDGAAALLAPSTAGAPSVAAVTGTVLLAVSNVCHVLPNASAKYIHLVVRQGSTQVLSVELKMGLSSHAEWNVTESSAALSRSALMRQATLSVELHAMDVVENKGEDAAAAEPEGEKTATAVAASAPRQRTSISAERLLIGKAQLPTARLLSVGAGEVDVITLPLENRPSSPLQSNGVASAAAEGTATVSFCIIGNRS